ncbi:MAG: hypothetical protein ACYC1D_15705 [Acidimicrobiales bacterium]
MAAPVIDAPSPGRADIKARTLRQDRWWKAPVISAGVLLAFIAYSTWAAFQNADYFAKPYLSPFYSPCLASICNTARNVATSAGRLQASTQHLHVPDVGIFGNWWAISPAILILIVPLGFRFTCYYYRRAYYRAFWQSPTACAVAEPHKRYSGETRFPLILQNSHRYFFYLGLLLNVILTYDAVVAFRNASDQWGHMGLGTVVLVVNALLLWTYSLSCHSCRHIVGGRLKHFSRHPIRFKFWGFVSKLNAKHMQIAWASLVFVALTDLYIRLVASGTIRDPRFF